MHEEAKKIAIEFAIWLNKGLWSKHEGPIETKGWYNTYRYSTMENPLSSEQLFSLFLTEKK